MFFFFFNCRTYTK